MTVTDRLSAIREQLGKTRLPITLVSAIADYLGGAVSLAAVQREWQSGQGGNRMLEIWELYGLLEIPTHPPGEIDLRLLDIGVAIGAGEPLVGALARAGWGGEVFAQLLSHGFPEQELLEILAEQPGALVGAAGHPSPSGRFLLDYGVPRLLALAQTARRPWTAQIMVHLLLAATPPAIDAAWQIAQAVQHRSPASPQTAGVVAEKSVRRYAARAYT